MIAVALLLSLAIAEEPLVCQGLESDTNSELNAIGRDMISIARRADTPAANDYCARYCSRVPATDRMDCAAYNRRFSEYRAMVPVTVGDDFTLFTINEGALVAGPPPRSLPADVALATCLGGSWTGLSDAIKGNIQGIYELLKIAFKISFGGGPLMLLEHRKEIQTIVGQQWDACVSKPLEANACLLDAVVGSKAFADKLRPALSALAEQLQEAAFEAIASNMTDYGCSNPRRQLQLVCEVQSRIYSEVLLAATGGEIFEALSAIMKFGARSEAAVAAVARIKSALAARNTRHIGTLLETDAAAMETAARAPRQARYNPAGATDNCVACTSAFLRNAFGRRMLDTAESLERGFRPAGIEQHFDIPRAVQYIQESTHSTASPRPIAFMEARAPAGHYAIFYGGAEDFHHVVSAWITPGGRKFIFDPQIARTVEIRGAEDWSRVMRNYGAVRARPYLFTPNAP
jgi:hypothetical protein